MQCMILCIAYGLASMTDDEFWLEVEKARSARQATQADIALACDVTQPHLSKVLAKKVPLTEKMRNALEAWLGSSDTAQGADPSDEVADLVQRLSRKPAKMHKQIMQILRLLDGLTS
jgi:transcriptional regulator with XRE-family HTH domain